MGNFYITTTLPYVNAAPHIGFALEIVTADVIARYQKYHGHRVIFNTGTDEHGLKIYQEAIQLHLAPQVYVDGYAQKFKALKQLLNLDITNFIRTSDPHHIAAAKKFWQLCETKGDIYKKQYQVKYCVGCELEKTESELIDGRCPLHPNKEIEIINEENYFFRFSKYQQPLLDLFANNPTFVKPDSKMKEVVAFVKGGLLDFSISRLKTKMPWGIDVPNDPDQVMYVWFDALINYISTLGWPNDMEVYTAFWPGVQIAGKDNLRQQSTMWQAMLLSAGLLPSKQILINGFISVEGQKMSKSMGNVISPMEMVSRYGIDGTRYLLLALGPVSTDMDVSWQQFDQRYNGYLANSLGNTIQRIATLAARSGMTIPPELPVLPLRYIFEEIEGYRFDTALAMIWNLVGTLEKRIDEAKPWMLTNELLYPFLSDAITQIRTIGSCLAPFMPDTSRKIQALFAGPTIVASQPLFPRLTVS